MLKAIKPTVESSVLQPLGIRQVISHSAFDKTHVLNELKHYLPSQTPLKDFIHHNSLHAFQHLNFYDAIFKASKIFGFQVTLELNDYRELFKSHRITEAILDRTILEKVGEDHFAKWKEIVLEKHFVESKSPYLGHLHTEWKNRYSIDIDNLVQPLLFRVLTHYFDQGISTWKFPVLEHGFIDSLRNLESNSFNSLFRSKRAQSLLLDSECTLTDLLNILVGKEAFYEQYLFDQQFRHRGWSGMVSTLEAMPNSLLDTKRVTLEEVIRFELLLEIDALDSQLGNNWKPLCINTTVAPLKIFKAEEHSELNNVFKIWQDAFEWSYYDEFFAGLSQNDTEDSKDDIQNTFQAIFCIDERECSIRRHLELTDPHCATLGTPGFFGVEFYFQPENAQFYDKLCPAPVTPKYLIKESGVKTKRGHEYLYSKKFQGWLPSILNIIPNGLISGLKLYKTIFKPKMSPAISNAFIHMSRNSILSIENTGIDQIENGLQIGFTIDEMITRVENQLRGMGLLNNFAPIIYLVAHGSSSANNPHHGAHDCGACSGRPGSVNARVLATMANHPKVRQGLNLKGIHIPDSTQFIGALHDTAADEIEYYDENILTEENRKCHLKNCACFERALDLNAKERSRRFASIKTKQSIKKIRRAIKQRSVSLFEPRPELGHGTNTLCIVGRRSLTKNLFLDRRAFLNSYDYRTDLDGKLLAGIMKPLGPVCGGINLEYYFSRVDNHKLGAGTKLPHNVMGLIGVANSCDGDLRPGLPLQMIEVHDPLRLMIVVEHFPEVILKTIQSTPEMYEWFKNEWVHIAAFNPETKKISYFKDGFFSEYSPIHNRTEKITEIESFIESANEMATNHILHATKENLPLFKI